MLVISPLTKFALATRPVHITIEIWLGLEPNAPHVAIEDPTKMAKSHHSYEADTNRQQKLKRALVVLERVLFTCLSVVVSILVPDFGVAMGFLGSFSAFLICVIGPVAAHIALKGKCGWVDGVILLIAIAMAVWGTGSAFWLL